MRAATKILTTLTATTLLTTPTLAHAVEKPDMSNITAPVPDGGEPKPTVPMKQTAQCATSGLTDDIDPTAESPINKAFNIPELHKYATGKGVKIAIIDSGVTPNPRLPNLKGGGDYVMGENGLDDCDHHGTLIASIIGAQPSPNDTFQGIAPDAELISIRQTSGAYGPEKEEDKDKASSTLATLANGIVRATNMGADVINMSVTSCYPATTEVDTNDLKAALNYAYQKGVIMVTAAGNANGSSCTPNPGFDPKHGDDPRNWEGATTISMPSYYTSTLISVGGTTPTMQPFLTTMSGPWVDTAAPATDIIGLDPKGNGTLTNASADEEGNLTKLTGTSFSSAYISGLVALMLEKEPGLTPKDVEDRLKSASRPGPDALTNVYGAGVIDSLGVLTTAGYSPKTTTSSQQAPEKKTPQDPYLYAMIATGIIALISTILFAAFGTNKLTTQLSTHKRNPKK